MQPIAKRSFLVVLGALAVSVCWSGTAAAEDTQPSVGGKRYGAAGCGLGSILFEASNKFEQVFAATTNGTSYSQTFGISSGTSNCDGEGFRPTHAAAYIQTNRSALAKDIARGRGATLSGLSQVAGCADSRAVGRKLQASFDQVFTGPEQDDIQVSSSMIAVLRSDPALQCKNLAEPEKDTKKSAAPTVAQRQK